MPTPYRAPALPTRVLDRLKRERWAAKREDARGLEQRLSLGLVEEGRGLRLA